RKPIYIQVLPRDFWHEQDGHLEEWVAAQFDVRVVGGSTEVAGTLTAVLGETSASRIAFLGEASAPVMAALPQVSFNPPGLLSWLDYHRACKSSYEAACIRHANRLALAGHTAARH